VGGARPPALVAVHVAERPAAGTPAQAELEQFVAEGTADYAGPVEALSRSGDAVAEILAAADAKAPDLVLLGTHGRSGWRRMRLGSVAEALVRDAPISVLVVPPAAALAGAVAEAVLAGTAGAPD
jgi:nucleotide-binding universal stress UspA family protein